MDNGWRLRFSERFSTYVEIQTVFLGFFPFGGSVLKCHSLPFFRDAELACFSKCRRDGAAYGPGKLVVEGKFLQ